MDVTPQKTGQKIDQVINSLNAKWDLGLPRLHGVEAMDAEASVTVAKRCSSRIRYLCFRAGNIDSIVSEFEDRARQLYSQWVYKPSQQRGTLPILPVTKSSIERNIQLKRETGPVRLTDRERGHLLNILFSALDDDFRLARISDSYCRERVSDTSFNTTTTTQTAASDASFYTAPPIQTAPSHQHGRQVTPEAVAALIDEPQLKDPTMRSSKRSLESPNARNKRQQMSRDRAQLPPPVLTSLADIQLPAGSTRFETIPSSGASTVFTAPDTSPDCIPSNATSIDMGREGSEDLLPTQDYNEIMADKDFSRSFTEACATELVLDPTDLRRNSPFTVQANLPSHVPYWYQWEIYRVAPILQMKPLDLYEELQKGYDRESFSFPDLWQQLRARFRHETTRAMSPLPKSELREWTTAENKYEDLESNKVVYLTAALDWRDNPSKEGLFKLRLNEMHLEKSCRLHRKFGADRFLVVSAPVFSAYPEKVRKLDKDSKPLHEKITDFLATESHFIAGREWRVCFVEQEKSKARAKMQQSPRLKITMFAVSGHDIRNGHTLHQVMTLKDLIQWHMPIEHNLGSTDLKLFSRWSIAFSKTTSTIELRQDAFKYLPDEPGAPVMNDGCALMSYSLAKAIWAKYGGEGEPPSAVQGRIAGAKGVWIVDYHNKYKDASEDGLWIEVSDSQLKIKPHPRDWSTADAHQRTFEVLKYAGDCREGHLNLQLITILEDRGVPRKTIQSALESDVRRFSESLQAHMKDPVSLRLWMHEYAKAPPSEASTWLGSFPLSNKDQLQLLLESGFSPRECGRIVENAQKILGDYLSSYVEKMWIQVQHSTVVFCVPDPLGVLAEDEVYLGFSSPIKHPTTGLSEWSLEDLDVLVARNPAYLASDVQKRRAVYKHELRHYKNVILFSTRGSTPLASLLSGGDYDGDTVFVAWDHDLVKDFQNADLPQMPSQKECGMVQMSRPLREIFNGQQPSPDSLDTYLRGCISFNSRPSLMGVCSIEHEKLVYSLSVRLQKDKLAHPGAVKLASLAGYLVDSNKQGWCLEEKAWFSLRHESSGNLKLARPAFKEDTPPRNVGANVIDFLKFDVAYREKEFALTEYNRLNIDSWRYDRVLSEYWKDALRRGHAEKASQKTNSKKPLPMFSKEPPKPTLSDFLEVDGGLLQQVDRVIDLWKTLAAKNELDSSISGETKDPKNFHRAVQLVYEELQAIHPKEEDHELRRRFEEEEAMRHPLSYWSLLRTSCLHYRVCQRGKFPVWVWYVAGRELCHLKVLHHDGDVKLMTGKMHEILKVDAKYTRRLVEGGSPMGEAESGDDENEQ